jgi:hypothetical protein
VRIWIVCLIMYICNWRLPSSLPMNPIHEPLWAPSGSPCLGYLCM